MVETVETVALSQLPLAPRNPLPYRQQVQAIRTFHTGLETLRDAGGPVTRLRLAPRWLMPPVVDRHLTTRGPRHPWPSAGNMLRGRACTTKCATCSARTFRPHPRTLASAPTRAATDLHQASRPRIRRAHGPSRGNRRRHMGPRHRSRPRHRMPQADAAGAGPLGARTRPGQPLRCHRRATAGHDEVRRRSGAAPATASHDGCRPRPADARAPPATSYTGSPTRSCRRAAKTRPGTRRWCRH